MKQEYTAPEAKLLVFSPNEALARFSFDDLYGDGEGRVNKQDGAKPGSSDITVDILKL